MKRMIALLLVCMLASATAVSLAEGPRFVTVQEWLEAGGECGDCMLLLKIRTILNPVLAVGEDETGEINLFSGQEDGFIVNFMDESVYYGGYLFVIANPRYNEFEGSVEMADWTVLRTMPPLQDE